MARLPRLLIAVCGLLAWPAYAGTGGVTGSVALEPMSQPPPGPSYRNRTRDPILDPEAPRAVVYLTREDGQHPPADHDAVVTVSQQGYQFRPAVTPVPLGAQVAFPNRDDEFHNVFSYSSTRRFDLGRFRKDEQSPLITFDQPGVVRVYCEIHKHMRGLLLVLDTPWYTTTDPGGAFLIEDLPAGRYTLHAFLPSERSLQMPVDIRAGETIHANLTLP